MPARRNTHMPDPKAEISNWIELWKAIHGGCWPGPPVDQRFNAAVNEVISGLAAYNLAHAFQDKAVGQALKRTATESLHKSLAGLQKTLEG
jgi:hypothetical protein